MAVAEAAAPIAESPRSEPTAIAKRRVLIVDDSETASKQIQIFLETDPSIAVDTASNGSEALKALDERPYSVVVTDLKMPRIDGFQLLAEVQKGDCRRTSSSRRDLARWITPCRRSGPGRSDFLTKPIDLEHLKLLVNRAAA